MVVTCRGDEAPLAAHVTGWLAQVRAGSGVEEIRLGPLSRAEVTAQAQALAAGPASARVIDELYARAEGNPFFTEQLVAAAQAGADPETEGGLRVPAGLPARLAELLTARADRCAGDARAVLAALAVAGRALTEAQLGEVTGLDREVVRQGLRELAAAGLLAEAPPAAHAAAGARHRRPPRPAEPRPAEPRPAAGPPPAPATPAARLPGPAW